MKITWRTLILRDGNHLSSWFRHNTFVRMCLEELNEYQTWKDCERFFLYQFPWNQRENHMERWSKWAPSFWRLPKMDWVASILWFMMYRCTIHVPKCTWSIGKSIWIICGFYFEEFRCYSPLLQKRASSYLVFLIWIWWHVVVNFILFSNIYRWSKCSKFSYWVQHSILCIILQIIAMLKLVFASTIDWWKVGTTIWSWRDQIVSCSSNDMDMIGSYLWYFAIKVSEVMDNFSSYIWINKNEAKL